MRKVTIYIFACLLFATMAVAQATSSQSSQQPAATQSQQQQPAATQSGQKPSGVQGTTANPQPPAQQSADQDSAQPAQRPAGVRSDRDDRRREGERASSLGEPHAVTSSV